MLAEEEPPEHGTPDKEKLQRYLSELEKQLSFAKMDLSLRPKLYEMLVKSASHGAGARDLKELLTTPNNMLTNEDLRRKITLITSEIGQQTARVR